MTTAGAPRATATLDLEVVIPVHDQEKHLEGGIRRLHGLLSCTSTLTWKITIADQASTDGTLALARRLSYDLDRVEAVPAREARPRRGRSSSARMCCVLDLERCYDDGMPALEVVA